MTFVARVRAIVESRRRSERDALYAAAEGAPERTDIQLGLLNASWERTSAVVPYFRGLRAQLGLPSHFSSLEEFAQRVPIMNRTTLQQHRSGIQSVERAPDLVRITGGSTAEPVQIPAWSSEFRFTRPDMWLARSWYGIEPASRLFLLWGHSHLLGTGLRGWFAARRRQLDDLLLGYRRFSAYDLREDVLRRAADDLLRFRPDYVVGYSVALDLFARANAHRRDALRTAGVKLVLAAAEGFPAPDSEERLSDLFACPIGMEYGAVETGLVAHTHPGGGYRVFWRSYLVEAERIGLHHRIRVTSLYPRCVPLLRYEIGDEIEPSPGDSDRIASLFCFERVIGRCNDYVRLQDGTLTHSEAFTHSVRACATIRAYQVVQEAAGIRLCYQASRELEGAEEHAVRERLLRIHPDLGKIGIVRVAELQRTIAGKTPMVIRR